MANPIPIPSVPLTDAQGRITPTWYEYFQAREKVGLSGLPDVKLTVLANGDAPVWNAVDGRWENAPN